MIPVRQAIVVEGRYDKNKLSQIFDTLIVPVHGFSVFKDKELISMLRRLAQERGIIVLTDPDGAGLLIRNYLRTVIPQGEVYHAYVPQKPGKERRKTAASKEGYLGVEGIGEEELIAAIRHCGASGETPEAAFEPISAADLYSLGLCGRPNSAKKKKALLKKLGLPQNLSTGALLRYLSGFISLEQLEQLARQLDLDGGQK